MTTPDKVVHARKRRVLNHAFSDKALSSSEPIIIRHVDRWCDLLVDGPGWSEHRNMTEMADYLLFDILGELCFGKSFETKEPGDNPNKCVPHNIAVYMQLMYPVSDKALAFAFPVIQNSLTPI